MNFIRSNRLVANLLTASVAVTLLSLTAFAQKANPKDPKNAELGMQLIKLAIEAREAKTLASAKG